MQLFGHDPEVMRSAAAIAAEARRRPDRHQHGLPGAEGAQDRRRRRSCCATPTSPWPLARGAAEGSGPAGDGEAALGDRGRRPLRLRRSPCAWSRRPASRRSASTRAPRPVATRAQPDYALDPRAGRAGRVPVIVSGGLRSAEAARRAYEESGADAVMIARGSLGNPWVFEELTGAPRRAAAPRRGRRRAALGDRPGRGAPRARAGGALPAQVLPLVRGAAWNRRRRCRRACSAAPTSTRSASCSPDGAARGRRSEGRRRSL